MTNQAARLDLGISETAAKYERAIITSWRKTAEAILETASLLAEAKSQLHPSEFNEILDRLSFSKRTADRLIAIGRDSRLKTHVSQLPPSWSTLYEITRLNDKQFQSAIDDGVVCPSVERKTIKELKSTNIQSASNIESKHKGMIKVCTIYVSEIDEGLDVINTLIQGYGDSETLVLDSQRFSEFVDMKNHREEKEINRLANRRAIRTIKDFDKELRRKHTINGKLDKQRYKYHGGEIIEFLDGGTTSYYDLPCTDEIIDNPINYVLNSIGHDKTTLDYYKKEIGLN